MQEFESQTKGRDGRFSRRGFTALSAAAGVAAAGGSVATTASAAALESAVEVKTPDGVCDAAFIHPAGKGAWPAVIIFPDALGLRPVLREMGARLANQGYAVLVVNQFYRSGKAPIFDGPPPNASDPNSEFRKRLTELRAPLTQAAVMSDADAFLKFLDAQAAVNAKAKAGAAGYCMGGAMTMQAAAARPDRIGAGASFHGAALATDKPDSPHLLVPKMKADFYFGVAKNDDEREPQAKVQLKDAYAAAGLPAKIEVYDDAMHGWCVKGSPVYNEAAAERAWKELSALYKKALV